MSGFGSLGSASRGVEWDGFAGIAGRMQRFVVEGEAMGIAMVVATKEKVVYEGAVGTADGVRGMRADDVFWIASISKPITAVAAALLVEEGTLRWEDPVAKYVPEFRDVAYGKEDSGALVMVAASRPITVRDLLTHTSGMQDGYERTSPDWTLEEYARQAGRQLLMSDVGRQWRYSSPAFDVVGRIVEVLSGMPFDQFLRKRLFEPLGMADTKFWLTEKDLGRYAPAYERDEATRTLKETPIPFLYGTELTDRTRAPLGGAGLFSTAQDIARFYQMTLRGGRAPDAAGRPGVQILKPETLAEMTRRQTEIDTDRPGMGSGYGFWVVEDPKGMAASAMLARGTYGHGGAFGTNAWADPTRGCVYVVFFERAKMEMPSNSPMRIAFQTLAAQALGSVEN